MRTRVIAIVNHKGGVGKTTTTLNLGKALSILGKRVLIIDIDPQSNLSQSVGIEEPPKNIYHTLCEKAPLPTQKLADRFDIVPADLELSGAEIKLITDVNGYFKLKDAILQVKDSYDFILIDCPPSLGILTINAIIAANEVILVVQSQYLAIKGLNTIMDLLSELRRNLNPELKLTGLLMTQVNRTIVSRSIVETVQKAHKSKVFKTTIRQNVALIEASTVKQDIFTYNDKSQGAEDYLNLAKEILN
ncbi:MAG: ParA family protein [Microscillaceae bacterium]|nr:ParA family protein [Microscillaceae bacterium]MDW8345370.1 ParA family protein [Bacteroidia bacterium]MDW8460257.1 ParA family protein [Cytophagales bacterium]